MGPVQEQYEGRDGDHHDRREKGEPSFLHPVYGPIRMTRGGVAVKGNRRQEPPPTRSLWRSAFIRAGSCRRFLDLPSLTCVESAVLRHPDLTAQRQQRAGRALGTHSGADELAEGDQSL